MEEWAVYVIQGMYTDVTSHIRVNGQYSGEFGVGFGVCQDFVLSPLLFILVLEALSHQFSTGVPWELLYANGLSVMADSLEECIARLKVLKEGVESRELRVSMGRTKFMVLGLGLGLLRGSGAFPCQSVGMVLVYALSSACGACVGCTGSALVLGGGIGWGSRLCLSRML